jgi:hypothetical protein
MSDFDELFRLMYAEQPDHVRSAAVPWAAVAKTVERAMAALEDGQRKLAEIWRSPAGTAYLAEMGRVVEAMRATSEAARHNDQVMGAAADALDGKQKDFAALSRAPMPEDARERYARAIVQSLDEDYHQAVSNFRPVPAIGPSFQDERPVVAGRREGSPSSSGGTGAAAGGSPKSSGTSERLPSWVPTQPGEQAGQERSYRDDGTLSTAAGTGPALQGVGGASAAPPQSPGSRSGVEPPPGTAPTGGEPRPGAWPGQPTAWTASGTPAGAMTQPGRRDTAARRSPRGLAQPPRGGAGLVMPEQGGQSTVSASGRSAAPAAGQHGAYVGGLPASGSSATAGRPWSGYRRRPEIFPTSSRHTAPPVIAPADGEEPEQDEVATDYIDDLGNRITIRRPRD